MQLLCQDSTSFAYHFRIHLAFCCTIPMLMVKHCAETYGGPPTGRQTGKGIPCGAAFDLSWARTTQYLNPVSRKLAAVSRSSSRLALKCTTLLS